MILSNQIKPRVNQTMLGYRDFLTAALYVVPSRQEPGVCSEACPTGSSATCLCNNRGSSVFTDTNTILSQL